MRRKAETARARAERICSELPELREWKRPPKDAEEVLHRGFVAVGWGRWGGPSRRPLPRPPARWRRGDPFIVRNDLPPEAENPPPPLDGTGTEADWRRWCHDLVAGNVPPAELVDDFFARYDEATTLRGLCRKNPLIFLLAIVALVDYVVDDDMDAMIGPVQNDAWLVFTEAGRWWLWPYGVAAPADRRAQASEAKAMREAGPEGRGLD